MKEKAITDGSIKSLLVAPFFSHEVTASRPLLVSEVLASFGAVDIVTTNFDHQTKTAKRAFQFPDIRTINYLPTLSYRHNISASRFLSHLLFSFRAWSFILKRKEDYDVVYITLPLNLVALLVFLSRPGKVRIADVVDIWPDVLPFPSMAKKVFYPFFALWKKTFALSVKHCDVLLAVSDRFMAESIPFFSGDHCATQRFYIASKRLARNAREPNGPLTIAYIGNIGHLYDFETLLESMRSCTVKPRFFLIGDGDRQGWLLKELQRLNIEHRYFGVVYDDDQLSEILSSCHMGFNGYRNTSAAFSYKANTYFAAGLPILNSMDGDLHHLVEEYRLGFNYIPGDVDSLRSCIQRCSTEDLPALSRNVDSFFESEIEHGKIKSQLAAFIGRFLTIKGT